MLLYKKSYVNLISSLYIIEEKGDKCKGGFYIRARNSKIMHENVDEESEDIDLFPTLIASRESIISERENNVARGIRVKQRKLTQHWTIQ